jgi:c-di-GMP-binding flagellar brake protein YcgR
MNSYYLSDRMLNLVRGFIINRRKARRISVRLPLRFAITRQGRGLKAQKSRSISAQTFDLSSTGLGIETSVIQIDSFHVSISADMASDQRLDIELELPDRLIRIEARPIRYERKDATEGNYIVGVQIALMSEEDREAYEAYLKVAEKRR